MSGFFVGVQLLHIRERNSCSFRDLVKFKVVTGKNLKLAGIEKDELWWGLHWQDFSTLLRKSILRRSDYLETIHR